MGEVMAVMLGSAKVRRDSDRALIIYGFPDDNYMADGKPPICFGIVLNLGDFALLICTVRTAAEVVVWREDPATWDKCVIHLRQLIWFSNTPTVERRRCPGEYGKLERKEIGVCKCD